MPNMLDWKRIPLCQPSAVHSRATKQTWRVSPPYCLTRAGVRKMASIAQKAVGGQLGHASLSPVPCGCMDAILDKRLPLIIVMKSSVDHGQREGVVDGVAVSIVLGR